MLEYHYGMPQEKNHVTDEVRYHECSLTEATMYIFFFAWKLATVKPGVRFVITPKKSL
jgi:hypothetical protein